MFELLTRMTSGTATPHDLELLEDLCDMVSNTSLCGLGQSAPNPVLSTLRYFREEYTEHIVDKHCRGGRVRMQQVGGGLRMNPAPAVKTLVIDGMDVSASGDQTILDAARENGISIPTLCHLDGLTEVGACRMCLVELKGSTKLQPACVTLVEEGMEVTTQTPRLEKYRRMVLELLFAERNHVCSVCVANNMCELQDQAKAHGVTHVRFPYRSPRLPVDVSHERFALDHNRCILCTRCVRVCNEIEGAHTWDILGRGVNSLLISDLHEPWGDSDTCTSCGKCVQVCPTGALFDKSKVGGKVRKNPDFLSYLNDMREGLR